MLQIGAALFYYKLGQTLLQIGAASLLLHIKATVITKQGSYYKLAQNVLLGQVLQIRAIIINWGITHVHNQAVFDNPFINRRGFIHVGILKMNFTV